MFEFPHRAIRASLTIASTFAITFTLNQPAKSADAPIQIPTAAPTSAFNWSGLYFGGHVGFGDGTANATAFDPDPAAQRNRFGGMIGGAQFGYNYVLPSSIVLGLEADVTFLSYFPSNTVVASVPTANGNATQQWDLVSTFRSRVGVLLGSWMVYGTGGLALAGGRYLNDQPAIEKALRLRPGWSAGAGIEFAFAPMWMARLEYIYDRLDHSDVTFPSGAHYQSAADFQAIRVGLNRKLEWPGTGAAPSANENASPAPIDWQIHGQTTYVQQGYPSFHSPYSGPQSLSGSAQTKNTVSATAFLGMRPWQGGEVFFAPEIAQGFGLSGTLGVAGFPNGEAQKAGFPYPHYNTSRAFFRQTFGLGGEQETIESDGLHMGGKVDVSRVTITAGRMFLPDFIDNNAYSDEPRTAFMNWSNWAAGAFDFPADQLGYSWGAIVELNQKHWAVRVGYLLMDAESNSNDFDMNIFKRGEYLVELENRYTLFDRPGKLRTIGWVNSAFTGSFSETLANPALNLDISQTRRGRLNYGYVLNIEQPLTEDIGFFGRWSWNAGKTETMAFTDINASLSSGLSIKGRSWGRSNDTVGIAGAINSISPSFRNFVAAGGMGVLIGDGQLNYRKEDVLETYYAIGLYKESTLTFDYQFIPNPAYNADRGPVSVFSGRFHAEF